MNALTPTQISDAQLPEVYENACTALAECEKIDECQEWADRAKALASYAKQAADERLEKVARRIRNRAIRRVGQLLEQIEPVNAARDRDTAGGIPLSRSEAAKEAGLSKRQKDTAMRVASLSEDEFSEAVEGDRPATVTELADRGTKKRIVVDHTGGRDPKVFNKCLHFVAAFEGAAKELEGQPNMIDDLTDAEIHRVFAAIDRIHQVTEKVEKYDG